MSGDATDWTNEVPSESFVTASRRDTDSDGDEDLVLTYETNEGIERTATIVVKTTGGGGSASQTSTNTKTITLTQSGTGSATVVVADLSPSVSSAMGSVNIAVDISGDATDWTNEAPSESFVTVSRRDIDSDGDEDLVLTYEANEGVERTATIVVKTTGGGGSASQTLRRTRRRLRLTQAGHR